MPGPMPDSELARQDRRSVQDDPTDSPRANSPCCHRPPFGSHRWQSATSEMRAKLEAARLPIGAKTCSPEELTGLPAPVQRYFRIVLEDGQPIVWAVDVEHAGTFNAGEAREQWRPFVSTQRVITRRPGFDWEGRIAILPVLSVRGGSAAVAPSPPDSGATTGFRSTPRAGPHQSNMLHRPLALAGR
jgi:hypothetical protein